MIGALVSGWQKLATQAAIVALLCGGAWWHGYQSGAESRQPEIDQSIERAQQVRSTLAAYEAANEYARATHEQQLKQLQAKSDETSANYKRARVELASLRDESSRLSSSYAQALEQLRETGAAQRAHEPVEESGSCATQNHRLDLAAQDALQLYALQRWVERVCR